MKSASFVLLLTSVALGFTVSFCFLVIPPLIENFDVIGAFAAGFVNPYAAGYAMDVISCWLILAIWVIHERNTMDVKHGWVCLLVGIMPGVAVGFALYLLMRSHQLAR